MSTLLADEFSISPPATDPRSKKPTRITSIDALRGLNVFTMIVVNYLAHNPLIPWWMQHFNPKANGMTFVDLVFPGFLFIAGMSIPFAIGGRLKKGESAWKIFGHVLLRVLSLLLIGVMMVNGRPDEKKLGWSPRLWQVLMFTSAIAAFCSVASPFKNSSAKSRRIFFWITTAIRVIGFAALAYLAFAFRGADDQRIITLKPFFLNVQWWGILGQIGWCYLTASVIFLLLRARPTAVLGCVALLVSVYFADHAGTFEHFWPRRYLNFGETFGTHAMLTTAGMLLGIMLVVPSMSAISSRIGFTMLFIAGFSLAALSLYHSFGINKNNATPSWGLWGCAATAALWLVLYLLGDVLRLTFLTRPLAFAGQNVLLAYLLSEMSMGTLYVLGLSHWYSHLAVHTQGLIIRACVTAVAILILTALLNLVGFRLKL